MVTDPTPACLKNFLLFMIFLLSVKLVTFQKKMDQLNPAGLGFSEERSVTHLTDQSKSRIYGTIKGVGVKCETGLTGRPLENGCVVDIQACEAYFVITNVDPTQDLSPLHFKRDERRHT